MIYFEEKNESESKGEEKTNLESQTESEQRNKCTQLEFEMMNEKIQELEKENKELKNLLIAKNLGENLFLEEEIFQKLEQEIREKRIQANKEYNKLVKEWFDAIKKRVNEL